MTDTAVAGADVDSSAQQTADEQGSTRRRVANPSMGRGERQRKVDVVLGGYEYTARCPKLVTWTDMATIIEEQRAGSRRERRRAGDTERAEDVRVTTDRIRITQAMTHFLRGCLSAADWQDLEQDLGDADNDLDLPDLWAAGMTLVVEFAPDMREMAKAIGMKVPGAIDQLANRITPEGKLVGLDDDQDPNAPEVPATPGRARGARKAAARKAAGSKAR